MLFCRVFLRLPVIPNRSLSVVVAFLGCAVWISGATEAVAQQTEEVKARLETKKVDRTRPDCTILQNLEAAGEFKTLLKLFAAADLVSELKGPGERTLFAPKDSVFEQILQGTVERLLRPENKQELVRLLKNHVANSMKVTSDDMGRGIGPTIQMTMGKDSILLEKRGARLTADRIAINKPDIACSNGVIHVIDGVLKPRESGELPRLIKTTSPAPDDVK